MVKVKKKKILIMITHSLGEIDVLMPLFAGVKEKYDINIEMVFVVKKIYRQFESNDFYGFCVKELDIKITNCQLPNKFDYRDSKINKYFLGRILIASYFKILYCIKFPLLFYKLIVADAYMHEISNQLSRFNVLYWIKKRYNKKIFSYHHAHGLITESQQMKKIKFSEEVIYLNFHEHSRSCIDKFGFNNQRIIGYPKFFNEWKILLKMYRNRTYEGQEIAVIYSRCVHPIYMDEDKYIKLLTSSCNVIREKLGNIKIIIKPHPREDIQLINKILNDKNIVNVSISWEHATILAKNAKLIIALFSSTVLDGLSFGIPSIEFYKEAERFREGEPKGSPYKNIGIDSTHDEQELSKFIDKVINGEKIEDEEDKRIQKEFWKIFFKYSDRKKIGTIQARISPSFLRKNLDLLNLN